MSENPNTSEGATNDTPSKETDTPKTPAPTKPDRTVAAPAYIRVTEGYDPAKLKKG